MRHRLDRRRETRSSRTLRVWLLSFLATFLLVHVSGYSANSAQTRDQCDRCCEKAGYDEYYTEQCKLKCFRNTDHCAPGKGAKTETPETPPQTTAPQPPSQPKAAGQPSEQPRTVPPVNRPDQTRSAFRFPPSLTLVPGREQEAAAQLLAANGIPPQHRNYPRALAVVQNVLVQFAKTHPTGGSLPTSQLERVIRQFKR